MKLNWNNSNAAPASVAAEVDVALARGVGAGLRKGRGGTKDSDLQSLSPEQQRTLALFEILGAISIAKQLSCAPKLLVAVMAMPGGKHFKPHLSCLSCMLKLAFNFELGAVCVVCHRCAPKTGLEHGSGSAQIVPELTSVCVG